ncbi:MAG TPA: GntR family transcriptional regulator [Azospirillaceae bacterium]|nr:GntR family transcriptional regulator [Azospirillaceae bacterium]
MADASALSPVDSSKLHERAYAELRRALMRGALKPGQVVTIRGLAEALGTSVMPIRDAVRQLLAVGALEALPRRAIRVPALAETRFGELWALRGILEGEACALAAERIGPAEIKVLEKVHAEVLASAERQDFEALLTENHRFFFTVFQASRSELLVSFIETLWILSGPHYNLALTPDLRVVFNFVRRGLKNHEQLIAALAAGDSEMARLVRQKDLLELATFLRTRLDFTAA